MFNKHLFGRNIREIRIKRNLSIFRYSILVDIGESQIGKIELGKHAPTTRLAVSMVNVLGVGIDDCLSGNISDSDLYLSDIKSKLSAITDKSDLRFLYVIALNIKAANER